MPRTIIDIHIIQTVPPSNVNRDDTGSPKTATYGGVRRARVSSQAWKRATRTAFAHLLDSSELGVRTKRLVELVGERIAEQAPELGDEQRYAAAEAALTAAGLSLKEASRKGDLRESGYLMFLSNRQLDSIAGLAVAAAREAGDGKPAVDKKAARAAADREHSVDVALFGRMVADATDLRVDAAAQVAHAISVHQVDNEYDYYTAVDDHKQADEEEDAGAGMIGTVEFNSSTLYRYATVDVDRLHDNLGDGPATRRAVEAFVRAFVTSMPTGKQNTFANRTLPDAVLLLARDDQPINLVGAFESPIRRRSDRGFPAQAAVRLAEYGEKLHAEYGTMPLAGWSLGVEAAPLTTLGTHTALDTAIDAAGALVTERLA